MKFRNISITDDVYELLSRLRLNEESFSNTIKRLARHQGIMDCAGLWSDVSDEEMSKFMASLKSLRQNKEDICK